VVASANRGRHDDRWTCRTGFHNVWHYVNFIIYLRRHDRSEYTGPEQYVYGKLEQHDLRCGQRPYSRAPRGAGANGRSTAISSTPGGARNSWIPQLRTIDLHDDETGEAPDGDTAALLSRLAALEGHVQVWQRALTGHTARGIF